MALTTMAGVIAGLRYPEVYFKNTSGGNSGVGGVFRNSWYSTGYPAAATANTSGMAGQTLTSHASAVRFVNPASGNTYLAKIKTLRAINVIHGTPALFDRLWEQSGIDVTVTTAQTINSVAWPARDLDGATSGNGVYIALEVSAAVGAATPTPTISYTNTTGTSGRTGTVVVTGGSSTAVGVMYLFSLEGADLGVKSVETITLGTSWISGTIHLIAVRPIVLLDVNAYGPSVETDAVSLAMPQLYDNSVLMDVHYINASAQVSSPHEITFTQG